MKAQTLGSQINIRSVVSIIFLLLFMNMHSMHATILSQILSVRVQTKDICRDLFRLSMSPLMRYYAKQYVYCFFTLCSIIQKKKTDINNNQLFNCSQMKRHACATGYCIFALLGQT